MSNVSQRLAGLSPEKRRLLEKMAKRKASQAEAVPSEAPSLSRDAIQPEQFSFEAGDLPSLGDVERFYDAINGQLNASGYGEHAIFLNYGYVPNSNPQDAAHRLPEGFLGRNAARLVLELIGDTPVDGDTHVLDVGCGRGGTLSVFSRFFSPGRMVGVDLSPNAVAFNRATHRFPNVEFAVGNAERLDLPDASFDVVTNVESSHTYNDIEAFYRETWRLLRPGGRFLYTDLMAREGVEANLEKLEGLGYVVERRRDITSNVLLSCDESAATHARSFTEKNDDEIMNNFLAVPGSRVYDDMKNGNTRYVLFTLRKA